MSTMVGVVLLVVFGVRLTLQAAEAVYSVLKAKGKIRGVPYGEVCLYKANLLVYCTLCR